MNTTGLNDSSLEKSSAATPKKPSRKEVQKEIRIEKARLKIQRKESFRKKTEKKLAEKAERKMYHKKENTQKKFMAKIEKKKLLPKT